MILRLIFGLALLGSAIWFIRSFFFPSKALPDGAISKAELSRLRQFAGSNARVSEALKLRDEIHKVIDEHPGADEGAGVELEAKVDAVTRQLLEQTTARDKVGTALQQFDANRHAEEILEAETKLLNETDEETRTALKSTLEKLQSQSEHLGRLRRRAQQLENAEQQIVVELRNVHLALLDAASSKAGLGGDRVHEIRTSLIEATETLRQTTDADEELARVLRQADLER